MPLEPGFVDANILVYAVNSDAPQHAAARALLEEVIDPAVTLYVNSQVLCEFYSVVTNPKRMAVAVSAQEALQVWEDLLALPGLHVLPAPAEALAALGELLRRHPVTGGRVFDLQIVATLKANNIHRIYTFNTGDFQAFPELAAVRP